MNTRLYVWAGPVYGWVLAAAPGTEWDHAFWRMHYRARKVCTAWVKRAP